MALREKNKKPCEVSANLSAWDSMLERDVEIRELVCRDIATIRHSDGKYYCLLHLPVDEKDLNEFRNIINTRKNEAERVRAEKASDDSEEPPVTVELDLRYVYFPAQTSIIGGEFQSRVNLKNSVFSSDADFSSVIFSGYVDFSEAVFSGKGNFNSAVFSEGAGFKSTEFKGEASFRSTTFSLSVNFEKATFHGRALFNTTSFYGEAKFWEVSFFNDADFIHSSFSESAGFYKTSFFRYAEFKNAVFSGDTSFSSTNFYSDALFLSATFLNSVDFHSVRFYADVSFRRAVFHKESIFMDSIFLWKVTFEKAEFLENSAIFFRASTFCSDLSFRHAMFAGFVSYEASQNCKIFYDIKAVTTIREKLRAEFEETKKELSEKLIDFSFFNLFIDADRYKTQLAQRLLVGMPTEKFEDIPNLLSVQKCVLDLQHIQLKNPGRISFHTVRLRPNWFANADSRGMRFVDCRWENIKSIQGNLNIKSELKELSERDIPEEKRLLEIACRQLAVNSEENNRYEDASKFRYMAMETKRLEYAFAGRFWTLNWWYRLSSGYGESWGRAVGVLFGLLLVFGLIFGSPLSLFEKTEKAMKDAVAPPGETDDLHKMSWDEGIVHSLFVATLQRPEPKPSDTQTKIFVIACTILGPLQAALLALAIRRKFMR